MEMELVGEDLLAYAAFAAEQDGDVGGGNAVEGGSGWTQRRGWRRRGVGAVGVPRRGGAQLGHDHSK